MHHTGPTFSQFFPSTPNPTLNIGGSGTLYPMFSTHSAGLPLPSVVPRLAPRPIYSYIWNLEGITGYKAFPDPTTGGLALGVRANEYFTAHGYQTGTVNLIQQAYEAASGMNDFVDQLSGGGLPITEARYIYDIICGN